MFGVSDNHFSNLQSLMALNYRCVGAFRSQADGPRPKMAILKTKFCHNISISKSYLGSLYIKEIRPESVPTLTLPTFRYLSRRRTPKFNSNSNNGITFYSTSVLTLCLDFILLPRHLLQVQVQVFIVIFRGSEVFIVPIIFCLQDTGFGVVVQVAVAPTVFLV